METSLPEVYLPEANSLPDGFVESSAEPSPPPPPSSADALDRDYKEPLIDLGPPVDSSVEYSSPQKIDGGGRQESLLGSSVAGFTTDSIAENFRECDIGGSQELYTTSVTEGSTSESNESLKNKKQDALLKSNQVFETFKQEMEKMAKLIKDLEKENAFLKNKCEQPDIAISEDTLLKSYKVFETFEQEMETMAKLIKDLKKENAFLKNKCEQSDNAIVKLIEEREA